MWRAMLLLGCREADFTVRERSVSRTLFNYLGPSSLLLCGRSRRGGASAAKCIPRRRPHPPTSASQQCYTRPPGQCARRPASPLKSAEAPATSSSRAGRKCLHRLVGQCAHAFISARPSTDKSQQSERRATTSWWSPMAWPRLLPAAQFTAMGRNGEVPFPHDFSLRPRRPLLLSFVKRPNRNGTSNRPPPPVPTVRACTIPCRPAATLQLTCGDS